MSSTETYKFSPAFYKLLLNQRQHCQIFCFSLSQTFDLPEQNVSSYGTKKILLRSARHPGAATYFVNTEKTNVEDGKGRLLTMTSICVKWKFLNLLFLDAQQQDVNYALRDSCWDISRKRTEHLSERAKILAVQAANKRQPKRPQLMSFLPDNHIIIR